MGILPPAGETDPFWSDVVLLCNFSDDLLDAKGHTLNNNGSISLSSSQSRYGTNSAAFSGSSQYFTIADSSDWYFSSDRFTVEFWWRPANITSSQYVISQRGSTNTDSSFVMRFANSGTQMIGEDFTAPGGTLLSVSANDVIAATTWHHVALVVDGTTGSGQKKHKLYIDGVEVSSITTAITCQDSSADLIIGKHYSLSQQYLTGYLNGLRITRNTRYWSDFTPSTNPWPTS